MQPSNKKVVLIMLNKIKRFLVDSWEITVAELNGKETYLQ